MARNLNPAQRKMIVLVSAVDRDALKAAFRQTCEVMLDNGLDLEQVYKDQDPNSFIEREIK
jgi:hypothetical protein